MNARHVAVAIVLGTMVHGRSWAAGDNCAAAKQLIHVARTDFPGLRSLKMQPGKCAFRPTEFKCRWSFPGDSYSLAEAQSAALTQCAAAQASSAPVRTRRGETLIALEEDLSLLVGPAQIDSGDWTVSMRIVAGNPPK